MLIKKYYNKYKMAIFGSLCFIGCLFLTYLALQTVGVLPLAMTITAPLYYFWPVAGVLSGGGLFGGIFFTKRKEEFSFHSHVTFRNDLTDKQIAKIYDDARSRSNSNASNRSHNIKSSSLFKPHNNESKKNEPYISSSLRK